MSVLAGGALVLTGAFLGGAARFWLSGLIGRQVGETFPWGTLAVNVTGAFAIGGLAALAADVSLQRWVWDFAAIGLLGGYTTVSSFSLQTLTLINDGQLRAALANVALSLGSCLLAVWAGWALAHGLTA